MNDVVTNRTPLVIATEINIIKHHTEKTVLINAVEIGKRLTEAKALLEHGEWGKWLAESVSYSHSTATRLMQIFREYGPRLLASSDGDNGSNYATLHNLTYSQALILLGVPEKEREELIADNDVENMSARDLQQAVSEKKQALEDRDRAREERNQALTEKENLQKELDSKDSEITRLTKRTQYLGIQADDYKQRYHAEQDKIRQKQQELDKVKKEVSSAGKITELEKDLKAAQAQTSSISYEAQFSIHRETIRSACNEILKTLTALARIDPEKKEINRKAVHEMLQSMTNMLKEWPPAIKTNLKINTNN